MKEDFLKNLREVSEKYAASVGCKVLSVEFVGSKANKTLKIVIDGNDISLDNCSKVSKKVSAFLDKYENEIPYDNYTLEVSSPGVVKKLQTADEFRESIGKLVYIETNIKAADGRKRYKGRVKSVSDKAVFLYIEEEGAEFELALDNISKARVEYEF